LSAEIKIPTSKLISMHTNTNCLLRPSSKFCVHGLHINHCQRSIPAQRLERWFYSRPQVTSFRYPDEFISLNFPSPSTETFYQWGKEASSSVTLSQNANSDNLYAMTKCHIPSTAFSPPRTLQPSTHYSWNAFPKLCNCLNRQRLRTSQLQ
jgi:hypothetical protein